MPQVMTVKHPDAWIPGPKSQYNVPKRWHIYSVLSLGIESVEFSSGRRPRFVPRVKIVHDLPPTPGSEDVEIGAVL